MQALPPTAYHCVKPADPAAKQVKMILTVGGESAQVSAWMLEVRRHPQWRVEADASSNGFRFVRLLGPPELPYREIGGLIYDGQVRHLSVAFTSDPPICGMEDD